MRLGPVRGDVVAHPGHVVDDERWLVVDVTGQRRAHRRDRPGFDAPGGRVEGLGGRDAFVALLDVADLDAQPGGELVQHWAPAEGEYCGRGREGGEFRGLAESEDLVHRGLVRVGGVVEHLRHPYRLDDPGYAGKDQRQNV